VSSADRPTAAQARRPRPAAGGIRGLPLRHVPLAVPVLASEWRTGAQWPPARLQERQRRLELLGEVWEGDLTEFFPRGEAPPGYNFARRLGSTVSELLLATRPALDPDPGDRATARRLYDCCDAAIAHMMRDGMAWVVVTVHRGEVHFASPPASDFHEIATGGWIWTQPFSAPDDRSGDPEVPDRLSAVIIDADGATWRQTAAWGGSRSAAGLTAGAVGGIEMLGPAEPAGVSAVAAAPRSPLGDDGWGTSLLEDLLPLIAAYARRLSSMAAILDSHERPLVAWWADEDDLSVLAPADSPPSRKSMEVAAGAAAWREHDVSVVPSAVQRLEYLTWNGELAASSAYLDRLDSLMRLASGVPAILESAGGVPSGVALRRLLLAFYASSSALQYRLSDALEAAVQVAYPGARVVWPHTLDELDAADMDAPEGNRAEPAAPMGGAPPAGGLDA